MKKPYILIMAGGSGTRIWPLSTKNKPKQLLPLASEKSLIKETVDRSLLLTSKENIYIGTNAFLKKIIKKEIPWLKDKNFVIEPMAKNTAPIIALFCALLQKQKKDISLPIVTLSADHYIEPEEIWSKLVQSTFSYADNYLYCIGIKPNKPNTNYGYIEIGTQIHNTKDQYTIKSFKEKPTKEVAEEYVQKGSFLWNSGMFIFSARLFLEQLKKLQPDMYDLACLCVEKKSNLNKLFEKMPNISVDYAIMEKSQQLAVIAGDFTWDDIGSFLAIKRIKKPDSNNNFSSNNLYYKSIASQNNIIMTENKSIKFALLGIENLVIVENNGIICIAHQDQIGSIKELREMFPEKNQ